MPSMRTRSQTPPPILTTTEHTGHGLSVELDCNHASPTPTAQTPPATAAATEVQTPGTRLGEEARSVSSPVSAPTPQVLSLPFLPASPRDRQSPSVRDVAVSLSWTAALYSALQFAFERLTSSLSGTVWKHFHYIWQGRVINIASPSYEGLLCIVLVAGLAWRVRSFSFLHPPITIQWFTAAAVVVLAFMPAMHWTAANTWECLWNRRGFAIVGQRIIQGSLGHLANFAMLYMFFFRDYIARFLTSVRIWLLSEIRRHQRGMEYYPMIAAIKVRDALMGIAAFLDKHLERVTSFPLVRWLDVKAAAVFRLLVFLREDPAQDQDTPVASFGAYPLTPSVMSVGQQVLGSSRATGVQTDLSTPERTPAFTTSVMVDASTSPLSPLLAKWTRPRMRKRPNPFASSPLRSGDLYKASSSVSSAALSSTDYDSQSTGTSWETPPTSADEAGDVPEQIRNPYLPTVENASEDIGDTPNSRTLSPREGVPVLEQNTTHDFSPVPSAKGKDHISGDPANHRQEKPLPIDTPINSQGQRHRRRVEAENSEWSREYDSLEHYDTYHDSTPRQPQAPPLSALYRVDNYESNLAREFALSQPGSVGQLCARLIEAATLSKRLITRYEAHEQTEAEAEAQAEAEPPLPILLSISEVLDEAMALLPSVPLTTKACCTSPEELFKNLDAIVLGLIITVDTLSRLLGDGDDDFLSSELVDINSKAWNLRNLYLRIKQECTTSAAGQSPHGAMRSPYSPNMVWSPVTIAEDMRPAKGQAAFLVRMLVCQELDVNINSLWRETDLNDRGLSLHRRMRVHNALCGHLLPKRLPVTLFVMHRTLEAIEIAADHYSAIQQVDTFVSSATVDQPATDGPAGATEAQTNPPQTRFTMPVPIDQDELDALDQEPLWQSPENSELQRQLNRLLIKFRSLKEEYQAGYDPEDLNVRRLRSHEEQAFRQIDLEVYKAVDAIATVASDVRVRELAELHKEIINVAVTQLHQGLEERIRELGGDHTDRRSARRERDRSRGRQENREANDERRRNQSHSGNATDRRGESRMPGSQSRGGQQGRQDTQGGGRGRGRGDQGHSQPGVRSPHVRFEDQGRGNGNHGARESGGRDRRNDRGHESDPGGPIRGQEMTSRQRKRSKKQRRADSEPRGQTRQYQDEHHQSGDHHYNSESRGGDRGRGNRGRGGFVNEENGSSSRGGRGGGQAHAKDGSHARPQPQPPFVSFTGQGNEVSEDDIL